MNELLCKLSEFEFIEIIAKDNIDFDKADFCCDEIEAYFIDNRNQILCIGQQSSGIFFEAFIKNLKKTIDGELQLHESIKDNLGFMWNENLQGKLGFFTVSTLDNSGKYWVGLDYEIWEAFGDKNPHVSTWLYNDNQGNIIFEVTKTYKWSTQKDDRNDPEFMTYKKFMKDYQPLIHRVIPRDVAIQWLEDSMKVYRSFFANEADFIYMSKKNLS